jgi:hypothetical protein
VIICAFTYNLVIGLVYEIPVPTVHDEFAYLLSSDTYSSGRITNPTHPMHAFFETFHVFHTPTYQAKYPPGQGLFLAIGQLSCGTPIVGAWLSMAMASGAMFWAFRRRFAIGWALLGAFFPLVAFHLNWQWAHSYWGGGVALLGGALLLGGVLRSPERKPSTALLLSLALCLLAISRQAEGLIAAGMLLAVTLIVEFRRDRSGSCYRFWAVVAAGGLIGVAINLYYNNALTGHPLLFTHRHWHSVIDDPTAPELLKNYSGSKPRSHLVELMRLGKYFLGPLVLTFAVFFFPKRPKIQREPVFFALVIGILGLLSIIKTTAHPHYLAPVLPLIYFLILLGLRHLWNTNPWGKRIVALAIGLFLVINLGLTVHRIALRPEWSWAKERAMIQQQLSEDGQHLVIVRYAPGHTQHSEYVYNAADIDAAPVVWARDLGSERNKELLDYFKSRKIWLLEADKRPNEVILYPDLY